MKKIFLTLTTVLAMMKYGIEDVRHFESGKLDFLEQF